MLLPFFPASWQHTAWHHNHHYFWQRPGNEGHSIPEAEFVLLYNLQLLFHFLEYTLYLPLKKKTDAFCYTMKYDHPVLQNTSYYKNDHPLLPEHFRKMRHSYP